MRWIFLLLLLAAACARVPAQAPVVTDLIEDSGDSEIVMDESYARCNINGIDHFIYGVFIYSKNDVGELVYTPAGEYLKPKDFEKWQFRMYFNKNDSVFNKTVQYIQGRELPDGTIIDCEEVSSVPSVFKGFISTHEDIFSKFRKEKEVIEFD